jgi:hypothetical protein
MRRYLVALPAVTAIAACNSAPVPPAVPNPIVSSSRAA